MASHVVVFTDPCGRVVVNIRNIEAPPRCPRLIFIKSDIVMFPCRARTCFRSEMEMFLCFGEESCFKVVEIARYSVNAVLLYQSNFGAHIKY